LCSRRSLPSDQGPEREDEGQGTRGLGTRKLHKKEWLGRWLACCNPQQRLLKCKYDQCSKVGGSSRVGRLCLSQTCNYVIPFTEATARGHSISHRNLRVLYSLFQCCGVARSRNPCSRFQLPPVRSIFSHLLPPVPFF